MTPVHLRDRTVLEAFFRRHPLVHVYELGDLDPAFAPYVSYRADADPPTAVALLYDVGGLLVLIAVGPPGDMRPAALCSALAPHLPDRLYGHLGPGVLDALAPQFEAASPRPSLKMGLVDPPSAPPPDRLVRLGPEHASELLAFYARAHPDHAFDPRSLARGPTLAIRSDTGTLLAVAGLHTVSVPYRAAAIGNVATDPAHRGQGLGRIVTAALCRTLLASGIDAIGLNVRADNQSAIACYRAVGFAPVVPYDEVALTRKQGSSPPPRGEPGR